MFSWLDSDCNNKVADLLMRPYPHLFAEGEDRGTLGKPASRGHIGEPFQSPGCISGTANFLAIRQPPQTHFVMESRFLHLAHKLVGEKCNFPYFVKCVLFLFWVSLDTETQLSSASPCFLTVHLSSGGLGTGEFQVLSSPLLTQAWCGCWFTGPPLGLLLTRPHHVGPFCVDQCCSGRQKTCGSCSCHQFLSCCS